MLWIIALLILGALLFGASAVIGAIGWVLGTAAAIVALVLIGDIYDLDPITLAAAGLIGFFVFCGLVYAVARLLQPYEIARMERQEREKAEKRSRT